MTPDPNSTLARMRAAAANPPPPPPPPPPRRIVPPQGGSGTAPPQGKKPKQPAKPAREKPPLKIYKEKVLYRCGHGLTPEEVGRMDCPACRDKKRKESAITFKLHHAQKKEAALAVLKGHPVVLRLPAGCVKVLSWAEPTYIHGTLTVPGVDFTFEHRDSSEEKVFRGLHDRYVRWLAKQQTPPAPEAASDGPQG